MKKQIIIYFLIIFILIVFFITEQNWLNKQQISQENTIKPLCVFNSDQEAYKNMIETNNKEICTCIKDENLKNTCMGIVSDWDFYKKATNDLNQDLCTNIKDEITKQSCILAVQDGLRYLESIKKDRILTIENREKIRIENPKDVGNLINLARLYKNISYGEHEWQIDLNNVNKAILVLEDANKIEKNNSDIYSLFCDLYYMNKNVEKALKNCNRLLNMNDGTNKERAKEIINLLN